jgi:micrococcal nuclease
MLSKQNKPTFAMSRHRRTIILAVCLLLAAVFIQLDNRPVRDKQQQQTGEQASASDFQKYDGKIFKVTNVVDGDTIDIDVPDGQHNHTRIRLWGIDTPETKNPKLGVMYFGPEAAEFTTKSAFGKQVTVYLDEGNRSRGKFGRLLAYVQLPDGRFLNEVLVAYGFAYSDLRFRHSFYNKYKQLEAGARSERRGLWENVTREQLPEWLQRMKPNLLNK